MYTSRENAISQVNVSWLAALPENAVTRAMQSDDERRALGPAIQIGQRASRHGQTHAEPASPTGQ